MTQDSSYIREFLLPSLGLLYPGREAFGKVRAWTGAEDKLISSGELSGPESVQLILERTAILPDDMEVGDLLEGDATAYVIEARRATFPNSKFQRDSICPRCRHSGTLEFFLPDAMHGSYAPEDGSFVEPFVCELPDSKQHVEFQLPRRKDNREARDRLESENLGVDHATLTMSMCILGVQELADNQTESITTTSRALVYFETLSPLDRQALRSALSQVHVSYDLGSVSVSCAAKGCSEQYSIAVQLTEDFFHPEISVSVVGGTEAGTPTSAVRILVGGPTGYANSRKGMASADASEQPE